MKTAWRLLAAHVCLAAFVGAAEADGNLLANGGFEARTAELMPAQWTARRTTRTGRAQLIEHPPQVIDGLLVCAAAARTGRYGLMVEARHDTPRCLVQQRLVVAAPERWHTFRVWARTDGPNPARAQIELYGDTYGPLTLSREVFLTPEWREISISFIPLKLRRFDRDKKEAWARLVAWPHTGRVMWDDAALLPTEGDEGRDPQKVMENPGWDEGMARLNAPSPTLAGRLDVGRATTGALHFEWHIAGDFNRNGRVEARFRRVGEAAWREGLPFIRQQHEVVNRIYRQMDYVCGNSHAGSLFPLEPGTAYEVRLRLTDPDGGSEERTMTLSTRPLPAEPAGGRTLHVYPPGAPGARQAPAFEGVAAAYAVAQPGDILQVHGGRHPTARGSLRDGCAYVLDKEGEPARPIILRGAGDGEALFTDDGSDVVFLLRGSHQRIENIAIEGTFKTAIRGEDNQGGVVRGCRIAGYGNAIAVKPRAWESYTLTWGGQDYWIADNDCTGPLAGQWGRFNEYNQSQGGYSKAHKPGGIQVMGQGHVIAHNRVRGYFDGLSTGGFLYRDDAAVTRCIEVYHNVIEECVDDGIELDGAMGHILFHHNLVRRATAGVSAQPVHGGPAYVFRNVFHALAHAPCKLSNWPAGLLIANNTFLTALSSRSLAAVWQNTRFLNNIDLGASPADGGPIRTGLMTPESSAMDYNGYRHNGKPLFWAVFGRGANMWPECDYHRARTPEEFVRLSGQEAHSVWTLSLEDFVAVAEPARGETATPDPRLREGSAAIDAGTPIPQITDGFAGRAPDLGALEHGAPLPDWGPRAGSAQERKTP